MNNGLEFEHIIKKICSKRNISNINQIKFPLIIPSVDIQTGETYIFTSKNKSRLSAYKDTIIYMNNIPIEKAVRSSCSFPGIYSPCKYNNIQFVDGGIRENIPWRELKNLGADYTISITFEKSPKSKHEYNLFENISESINLLSHELSIYEEYGSDYIVKIDTKNTSLLDHKQIDFLYNTGYSTMKKIIKENAHKL